MSARHHRSHAPAEPQLRTKIFTREAEEGGYEFIMEAPGKPLMRLAWVRGGLWSEEFGGELGRCIVHELERAGGKEEKV